MNFGEKESFTFKNPYFFKGYCFKFKGLKPDIKEKYEEAVMSMGATVLYNAIYTFCETKYFIENSHKENLYSLSYILNSMMANEPLDINLYRFIKPDVHEPCCCIIGKYILHDNCNRFYYYKMCCLIAKHVNIKDNLPTCSENRSSIVSDKILINNDQPEQNRHCITEFKKEKETHTISDDSTFSTNTNVFNTGKRNNDQREKIQNKNDVHMISIDLTSCDSDESDNGKRNTDQPEQNRHCITEFKKRKKTHIISDNSTFSTNTNVFNTGKRNNDQREKIQNKNDVHMISIDLTSCDSDESDNGKRNNKSKESQSLNNKIRNKKNTNIISDASTSSSNTNIFNTGKRNGDQPKKNRHFPKNTKQKIISDDLSTDNDVSNTPEMNNKRKKIKVKSSSSSDELSFSNDEEVDIKFKHWWEYLPKIKNENHKNIKHLPNNNRGRGATFTLDEQRVMIAYLNVNNMIDLGKSRKSWMEMIDDGYLTHRSVESLCNNFRKTILPNIHKFGLPQYLTRRFRGSSPQYK